MTAAQCVEYLLRERRRARDEGRIHDSSVIAGVITGLRARMRPEDRRDRRRDDAEPAAGPTMPR